MVELFLRWHEASEGGLWSVEGGEQKRVLGRTRDVPETLSLRPAEEGGTSKATANQGELAVGPCFDGGLSLLVYAPTSKERNSEFFLLWPLHGASRKNINLLVGLWN